MAQARKLVVGAMHIAERIFVVRGHKVIVDSDLAALYGVATGRFNEAVRRNRARFPADFMFQLDADEIESLRSQIAISKPGRGGRRYAPYVFTEHGAIMAATILNTPRATEVSVFVVRAFVQLRETVNQHKELAAKLDELERRLQTLAVRQDTLAANTRMQLKQVFEAIRELMSPPESTKKRPIGFVTDEKKRS